MLISKVGAEHYEQKKNHNGRTAYGFRAVGRSESPWWRKGASSNVVSIIYPPSSTLVLIVTLSAKI